MVWRVFEEEDLEEYIQQVTHMVDSAREEIDEVQSEYPCMDHPCTEAQRRFIHGVMVAGIVSMALKMAKERQMHRINAYVPPPPLGFKEGVDMESLRL